MSTEDMDTAPKWRGRRGALAIAATAAVAVLGGAAAVLAHSDKPAHHAADTSPMAQAVRIRTPAERSAGIPALKPAVSAGSVAKRRMPARPAKPRRHGPRTAITHAPLANIADATGGVAIRFNGDPAADTPRPSLSPHVNGHWTNMGPYEVFHPASTLEPCTSYTMTVPARTFVLRHRTLGAAHTVAFKVACPGVAALQESLARLRYLPYTLHGYVGASSAAALTRKEAARRAYVLPPGKLLPNVSGAPPLQVGTMDPTTTGALEVFESDQGLPITTTLSRDLWVKLLSEETLARRDPKPYTWVTVTKTIPETLEVHEGAKVALSSPTNTGVPGADTQSGIFPIYVRYVATTMIGTNVDGSHYDDPGVPWVNYFNGGDAVHGYIRPGYGYPQSNGCVELPISTAETVYGMLQIGDLVIVE